LKIRNTPATVDEPDGESKDKGKVTNLKRALKKMGKPEFVEEKNE
jgi:hypothetical protein